jgi:hypothetical protein
MLRAICLSLVGALSIPQCSSELSKADSLAVEACGLEKIESDGGDGEGRKGSSGGKTVWSTPDLSSSGSWTFSDPIEEHVQRRDVWAGRSPKAAAAAQIQATYLELSKSLTQLLEHVNAVLTYREAGFSEYDFYRVRTAEMYNGPLAVYKNQCAGLSLRLNS